MLTVISDAAGRMRLHAQWFRNDATRAVAIEDAVDKIAGVRAVHAYPRTASVVVWYSPKRCDTAAVLGAITASRTVLAELVPHRTPRSAEIANADVLRMFFGGIALALLGFRRYALGRPALLGPAGRLFATAATIITGYPFMRGAVRSLRGGRSAGTD
ncbi:MAG: copper-transporting ATPase, partial [Mycolicibacterium sp.]|nr:copper-transporting ATPase [Mycolicibacterium sp.]